MSARSQPPKPKQLTHIESLLKAARALPLPPITVEAVAGAWIGYIENGYPLPEKCHTVTPPNQEARAWMLAHVARKCIGAEEWHPMYGKGRIASVRPVLSAAMKRAYKSAANLHNPYPDPTFIDPSKPPCPRALDERRGWMVWIDYEGGRFERKMLVDTSVFVGLVMDDPDAAWDRLPHGEPLRNGPDDPYFKAFWDEDAPKGQPSLFSGAYVS